MSNFFDLNLLQTIRKNASDTMKGNIKNTLINLDEIAKSTEVPMDAVLVQLLKQILKED
jgi:hypothetical protein